MAGISAVPMTAGVVPQTSQLTNTTNQTPTSSTGDGSLDSLIGNSLGSLLSAGSSIYGSQNAAEAQNNGILAGIGQQNTTLGNINSIYSGQQNLGNSAFTQLGSTLGLNGGAPDYSGFENSPGYQFAQQQGTKAIQTQAAANGSAFTPNTLANIGQFVTGTASTNYNNYVSQLMSAAGIGASANQGLATANTTIGGNISQLDQNSGNAEASGVAGASGAIGGANGVVSALNSSGVLKGIGGAIGNLFGGSSGVDTSSIFSNDDNYLNNTDFSGGMGVGNLYTAGQGGLQNLDYSDPSSLGLGDDSNPW